MSMIEAGPWPRILLLCFAAAFPAAAEHTSVSSWSALQTAVGGANAGDSIIVADGVYSPSSPMIITRQGAPDKFIVITAAHVGGAEIAGSGGFEFDAPAQYVEIRGFKLTHKAGGNKVEAGASHCRFTRNLFQCPGTGDFVRFNGDDNEISWSTFQHKSTEYQMVEVLGPSGKAMAKRNWIHHNYFYDFQNTNANNSAAIEVGYSSRSMDSSFTLIEWNLFIDTRGESEGAICVKSSNAIIRYNTVGKGSTEISIRHGNHSQIYGNILMSTNGGLRFYGNDHRIYNNYFADCSPALSIGNGAVQIPPGPLNEHDIPDRCEVVFNTFVNNRQNPIMLDGGDKGANDLKFCNNLILGGNKALDLGGPTPGAVWLGNVIWNTSGGAGSLPSGSYDNLDPKLIADASGIFHLPVGSGVIGKAKGSFPYVTEDMDGQPRGAALDVGADQYAPDAALSRLLTPEKVGWLAEGNSVVSISPAPRTLRGGAPGLRVSLTGYPLSLLAAPGSSTGIDGRTPSAVSATRPRATGAWILFPTAR
jgi:poly(beta-D-mannuronate) lyase